MIKAVHTMHQHDEHCGCGCGHIHVPIPTPEGLTSLQMDLLLALRQRQCLPVACFSLGKTSDGSLRSVALEPVYLSSPQDTMEQVKELGRELIMLEDMNLLTLDYDMPLRSYPYEEYKTSELYAYFVKTVKEAAQMPNPTFDTPVLELGSMALTEAGEEMVDKLLA